MTSLARYIFVDHFSLAVDGALLMAVGLFIAIPVVKYRLGFLQRVPLGVMKIISMLMGERAGVLRMVCVIWLFNSTVMFLYMASGFHPMLPKIFGIWTGLNIGVVMAHSHGEAQEGRGGFLPAVPEGSWRPPRPLAGLCGLLVLFIELPCFFYSIALGMGMGGEIAWGGVPYSEAFPQRAAVYGAVIFPLLLISAIAETIAIYGGMPGEDEDDKA